MSGPGELHVRGGVGGIRARTDDMQHAAAILARMAAHLASLAVRLAAIGADPALLVTAVVAPATLACAEAQLALAVAGPSGLIVAGARIDLLGLRLEAAALAYRAAEEGAQALARGVDQASAVVAGLVVVRLAPLTLPALTAAAVPLAALHAVGVDPPWGRLPGVLPGGDAGVLEHLLGSVPGGVRSTAVALAAASSATPFLRDGEVTVSAWPEPATPPTGVGDLVAGIAACYPEAGAAPGTVRVLGVRRPDGRRAWIAEIPGTQDWSPLAGTDPFDLTADVRSMAGWTSTAARVVAAALAATGARPGEPVLLAGHSLGGMLAAGLAADPAFRARFTVTHVLTAGSPVARYPVPSGVQVLALEHTDDVVPALDGGPDPDRVDWVTVRRQFRTATGVGGPGAPHEITSYEVTAEMADRSRDPSLVAWRAGLAPFLAGPGVTATGTVVIGHRVRRR